MFGISPESGGLPEVTPRRPPSHFYSRPGASDLKGKRRPGLPYDPSIWRTTMGTAFSGIPDARLQVAFEVN